MQLAQRDADRPLVIAEIVKAIDGEVEALANSHARGAHEEKSRRFESAPLAELVTDAKVVFGRERSGKVLVLARQIPADKEVVS